MTEAEELATRIADEGSYEIHLDDEDVSAFPDGSHLAICTNWARYARRVGGERIQIFGFWADDNPASSIAKDHGGHDFAVLDDRWIVDGWLTGMGIGDKAVLDMHDPSLQARIAELYGPREAWNRNLEVEGHLDAESETEREQAMAGTVFAASSSPSP